MIRRPFVSDTPLALIIMASLILAGTVAAAQAPARDQPSTPGAGTGVIRGRVVGADTGEPLRRVEVRVDEWSTQDPGRPAATMTDADGRYELTQLPAGRYQLKARRGGYVEVAYGQRRPFERGRPLELADRAVLENIDFALPPGAVVTGRVVDETGEAVAHVSVSLARRRYVDGARRLAAESGSSTDDRREFRIFGVPPGDYVIVATFDAMNLGSRDRVRYVPTYYPGTPVASEWGPHSRFIESARPDQQGRVTIRGLPPGRYLAIAVEYLEPGDERDPDTLEAWRQSATSFTLSEGATHALDLRLTKF